MNIVKHRVYTLEFDVWEPLEKLVDIEVDGVIVTAKRNLTHAGNIKITKTSEVKQ